MAKNLLPDNMGPRSGLLNDRQIKAAIEENYLLSFESCDLSKVKYATYEIRVSSDFHKVTYIGGQASFTTEVVGNSNSIIIEPGQTIKVLAKEVFRIPGNIYAKINTVGQIFSAGLAAENTYADPGYHGQIYITLSNISSRRLSIKPGDPLARVEFHKIEEPVETAHSGENGIRKNFVNVETPGDVRKLLSDKPIEKLIEEMVTRSVDEALQDRHVRSEVLIEKAHTEIGELKKLREVIIKLRWIGTSVVFLLVLVLVFSFDLGGKIKINEILSSIFNVGLSVLAGYVFHLIQKKYL